MDNLSSKREEVIKRVTKIDEEYSRFKEKSQKMERLIDELKDITSSFEKLYDYYNNFYLHDRDELEVGDYFPEILYEDTFYESMIEYQDNLERLKEEIIAQENILTKEEL